MTTFDPRTYVPPRPSPALIRATTPLARLLLRGPLRIAGIDLPAADEERLREALRPGAATFVASGHPDFACDWLLDRELARRFSPLMAYWASWQVVNHDPLTQWFWLRQNLIANTPGGGGRADAVRWALAGHGVLTHPEGTATWHGDRIGPLLPGLVDMAVEAATLVRERGGQRPVWIVPLVWKLRFTRDVSRGLAHDMAALERGLGLPGGRGRPAGERFARLVRSLLQAAARAHGVGRVPAALALDACFATRDAVIERLRARLIERFGRAGAPPHRAWAFYRRAIAAGARKDPGRARADEGLLAAWWCLTGLDPDLYDRPTLTQEAIAENLKRFRTGLLRAGIGNAIHNLAPRGAGSRVIHVRMAAPLDVAAPETLPGRQELLDDLAARMQAALDRLGADLAPLVDRFRTANPLWSGRGVKPG